MSTTADEDLIREMIAEQQRAWNAGDATAYAAKFHVDGTFTNVFGDRYFGREAFRERHATIFNTFAKGSKASLGVGRIHFPVPGTALVDIDCTLEIPSAPPGLSAGASKPISSALLQVLVKERDQWWIAGYHNVDVKPMPGRAS